MDKPENPEDAAGQWSEQIADMRELAISTWRFYDELGKAGFTPEQSMMLTMNMMSSMIANMAKGS